MRYVFVANPGTPRCEHHAAAVRAAGDFELVVVPWVDVIPRHGCLDDLPAFDAPAVVRLESPGRDARVAALMLEAGGRPASAGWRPGTAHAGFVRALCGLHASFAARPHLRPTACPLAVAAMFDKAATSERLSRAGLPTPELLPSPFDDGPTYAKLNTGSAGAGIIAIRNRVGVSSLVRHGDGFASARRPHELRGDDLEAALAFLRREGLVVQRGIAFAQIDGANFDVRVVCVAGDVVASIFRVSPHPMTNLNLGGRRGGDARCRAAIPPRAWLDALDDCAVAARLFDATVVGVDLIFERGYRRHFLLEVNAFGDFFPGWTDAAGRGIPTRELAAIRSGTGRSRKQPLPAEGTEPTPSPPTPKSDGRPRFSGNS